MIAGLPKRDRLARTRKELFPDFSAFIEEIDKNGITPELLYKIIQKHRPNARYNKMLYDRYMAIYEGVDIDEREPRFAEANPINNKVNNDFMGEIVNFKVGYFAGEPHSYSYADTEEAEEVTGGEKAVDNATKVLTDFVTRNNMFGVDMKTTLYASVYGYAGRLFYIDDEKTERVMPIHGFEVIPLSNKGIAEPKYAIWYRQVEDINGAKTWNVEFYDNKFVHYYKGELSALAFVKKELHLFDYCPLQGIANNDECMGDAEKVLPLINDYDKVFSDNSNEIEQFVHALLVTSMLGDEKQVEEVIRKAQVGGALNVPPVGNQATTEPIKWATKNINDAFTEHHIQRTEDNIYRFSRTPNLKDESFGTASGVALKFKLHGLETKCAVSEAHEMDAAQHMWRVLCSSWNKRGNRIDPLQIVIEFHRNFPQDDVAKAQAAQAEIAAGVPMRHAFRHITDDVDYLMEMREAEQEDAMALFEATQTAAGTADEEEEQDKASAPAFAQGTHKE